MFFWIMLIILAVTTVASYVLTPRPKTGAPQPSALGDFKLPTAEAGRCVPVIFGTVKLTGGNCTYWGDLQITPLREHKQIYAYQYRLGIQLALCYGKVQFLSFLADDKVVPITSGIDGNDVLNIWVRAYDFFGGNKREGGVAGTIMFYDGHDANDPKPQVADAYLARIQGRAVPAYRGICHAVFVGFYVGTSSYVKSLGFILKRCPNPFNYPTTGAIPLNPTPVASFAPLDASDHAGSFFDQANERLYWIAGNSQDADGTLHATVNVLDTSSRTLKQIPLKMTGNKVPGLQTNWIMGDASGNIYLCVTTGYGTSSIFKFASDGTYIDRDGSSLGLSGWGHGFVKVPNCSAFDPAGRIFFVDWSGLIVRIDFNSIDAGTGTHCKVIGKAHYNGGMQQTAIPVVDASGNVWVFSYDQYGGAHNFVSTGSSDFPADDMPGSIQGGLYVAADNTIIWGTDRGLYKWDIATHKVVATLAQPAAGLSRYADGGDGFFVNGVSKINARTLQVQVALSLAQFTLPNPGDRQNFGHQYDGLANTLYMMDNTGTVQALSLASTGAGVHDINGDANPALAIYDLLTHPVYGLRKPAASIDRDSFDRAARTLSAEGLGVSQINDTPQDADAIISDLLRHIDGTLYCDPQTGLFTLDLARGDYDPDDLPVLTVDEVLEAPDYSRGSWAETTNEVKVTFTNRSANFNQDVSAPCQDTANIAITGSLNSETIDFKALSNQKAATLVAARCLRALSYPLAKLTVKVNRTAWKFRPGKCFRFTWSPLGIEDQVFRVAKISYGKIDDGKITIDAVEDVFNLSTVAFTEPPGSGWTPPGETAPPPAAAQALVELPYNFATDGIRVAALAARGDSTSYEFDVYQANGSTFEDTATIAGFSATAKLSKEYARITPAIDPVGFSVAVDGSVDLGLLEATTASGQRQGANLLIFETGEIASWQTITFNTDGTATFAGIMRGLYDTTPASHSAGERVWLVLDGEPDPTQPNPYPADELVRAKLTPRNFFATVPLGSAPELDLQTASRYAKPWPPGNLRMSGRAFGSFYSTTLGDVTFSWSSRNRITQTSGSKIVAQDEGDQGAIEGSYTIDVLIDGNVVRSVAGSTAESFTYTATMRIADATIGDPVVLRITPKNGSLAGNAATSPAFTMTGFGLQFGRYFGGIQQ